MAHVSIYGRYLDGKPKDPYVEFSTEPGSGYCQMPTVTFWMGEDAVVLQFVNRDQVRKLAARLAAIADTMKD